MGAKFRKRGVSFRSAPIGADGPLIAQKSVKGQAS